MTHDEYQEYLKTPHWQDVRRRRLEIDGYRCALCGEVYDLNVHHRHYNSLWRESAETDTITLCRSCHENLHAVLKEYGPEFSRLRDVWRAKVRERLRDINKEFERDAGMLLAKATWKMNVPPRGSVRAASLIQAYIGSRPDPIPVYINGICPHGFATHQLAEWRKKLKGMRR